jgi:hypothetical protein
MSGFDLLDVIRAHLVASRGASDPAAGIHIAKARVYFQTAQDEMRSLENLLLSREAEWAHTEMAALAAINEAEVAIRESDFPPRGPHDETVHMLFVGRTLCGMLSDDDACPEGHSWVNVADWSRATCEPCRKEAARRSSLSVPWPAGGQSEASGTIPPARDEGQGHQ